MLRFSARVMSGDTALPFQVRISDAYPEEPEASTFCCDVIAPYLFSRTKTIRGEGAEQAQELAIAFVNMMTEELHLVGHDGAEIRQIRPGVELVP